VDSGTSVSLNHSAYVLESGELLILARVISAGSMVSTMVVVVVVLCEGDETSETNVSFFDAILPIINLEKCDMVSLQRVYEALL
jgi:folate-dependent tRNA-U54 methylase TrmFO/GidA